MDSEEIILQPSDDRFNIYPIKYPLIWDLYKQQVASFWTSEEIDLSKDYEDWKKLSSNEQHFIKYVLAFFLHSDGIVAENLSSRFINDVQIPEIRYFYGFQLAMENIHAETYSLLLQTYADNEEVHALTCSIDQMPGIAEKNKWALQWTTDKSPFAERLVAFAAVEGIFFSSSFCAIFWLKKRGLLPGLAFSNELISRDEGLHCTFACALLDLLQQKPSAERIQEIIKNAVEVELIFVQQALPVSLIGINQDLMSQYVRFIADRLLIELNCPPLYNTTNPFDWMQSISLQRKTNFFEHRVSEYQKSNILKPKIVFTLDDDF